jgi:predicted transposase/invertase (TIGR01784 family)
MARELVSPLSDYVFSLLFGDQRNIEVLEGFLKTILDIPPEDYQELTIVNPFLKRLFRRDKLGIVDVRAATKSGRVLHIELQLEKYAFMRYRTLYSKVWFNIPELCSGSNNATPTKIWY